MMIALPRSDWPAATALGHAVGGSLCLPVTAAWRCTGGPTAWPIRLSVIVCRVGKGARAVGRVAVIGDVGGHPGQLREALSALGAYGKDLHLPDDLTVIQVGDLIDRGPDSTAVLDLVGRYLDEQPGRWVQLIGNHEAQYLPGGVAFWRQRLADDDAQRLRSWWAEQHMQIAAAVRNLAGNEILITHAGLTVEAWQQLGEPMTATTAALLLNQRPEPLIWQGDGFVADTLAGPLWAEAGWDLYEPWMTSHTEGGYVPFDQVHGHSSVVSFTDQTWRCPGRVRQRTVVNWQARHVTVRIGGRTFTGIDPRHGRTGAPNWLPLVLDDADVIVGSARDGYQAAQE